MIIHVFIVKKQIFHFDIFHKSWEKKEERIGK